MRLAIALHALGAVRGPGVEAQEPEVPEEVLEEILSGEGTGELPPSWEYLLSHPLDLNRAHVDELEEVPFIDPERAHAIVKWRDEHGPFESLNQLSHLGLFSEQELRVVRPFLRVRGQTLPTAELRFRYRQSSAHARYPGTYLRLRTAPAEAAELGFVIERDPGESDWADFRCGSLTYRRAGKFAFVLGDFSVDIGQGLLFAGPYAPRPGVYFHSLLPKPTANCVGYRSSAENWMLRGAAAQFGTERTNALVFASWRQRDGHLEAGQDLPVWDLDGYHRTAGEAERAGALWERIVGAHASYRMLRRGTAGVTIAEQKVQHKSGRKWTRFALGGDWRLAVPGGLWAGEIARLTSGEWAITSLAYFARRDFEAMVAAFANGRSLATWFRSNPFFPAWGTNDARGAVLGVAWRKEGVRIAGRMTSLSSREISPADRQREDRELQLVVRISNGVSLETRVRETPLVTKQTVHDPHGRQVALFRRTVRRGFRLQLDAERGHWKARLRAEANRLGVWSLTNPQGILVYQQGQVTLSRSLQLLVRFATFDVRNPLAAIYAYEPDVPGTFYIRSFRSRGWQTLLYASWRLTRNLRLCGKAEWHSSGEAGVVSSASLQLDGHW